MSRISEEQEYSWVDSASTVERAEEAAKFWEQFGEIYTEISREGDEINFYLKPDALTPDGYTPSYA